MPSASTNPLLLPWLLRRANRLFLGPVRDALSAKGFADLSQRGMWAVHELSGNARSASELVESLQITKQAVSVLVEDLVHAGYVRRSTDPRDRRRSVLVLTSRGTRVASIIEKTCNEVERIFDQKVGAAEMKRLRKVLTTLTDPDASRSG